MCYKPINHSTYGRIPCGKCADCKKAHFNTWYQRLKLEAEFSYSAFFVTLTYDDTKVPTVQDQGQTIGTLVKPDLQKYFKRLRKYYPSEYAIRYYAIGEYGGRTKRPHYHAIIFNAEPAEITAAWNLDNKPIGFVHIGQVSDESIQYTLGYLKKPRTRYECQAPEFSIMSKGIGKQYIEQMGDWHRQDPVNRNFFPLKDGRKLPLARYYKERIFDDQMIAEIKEARNNETYQQAVKTNLTTDFRQQLAQAKQNLLIHSEKERIFNSKINHNKV